MRRLRPLLVASFATALVVAAPGIAGPGRNAAAPPSYGPKVDPRVAAMARGAASGAAELRLVVLGSDEAETTRSRYGHRRHRLRLVHGESMRVKVRDLLALARSGAVSYVVPDLPVQPTASVVPPLSALATQYPVVVGAEAAWNAGYTGEGVGIAVIDSGIEPIADLGGRLVQVQLDGQVAVPVDTVGHGTFVAAVAAGASADGRYRGVAPGATVYGLGVARPDGVYTSDVVAALDWVLANAQARNIRVVNLSLSEAVPGSYRESLLDTAVERLWRAGIVVVASSGNRGAGEASYAPANDPFVITVGALDTNGTVDAADDADASFSSRGTTVDGYVKPELAAPGRGIVSTLPGGTSLAAAAPPANLVEPGYARMSGTSFAAPQVAGAAAILLQAHPEWTPDQVKWVLTETAGPAGQATARALRVDEALRFTGVPGAANGGLQPTLFGLEGEAGVDLTTATWNTATWNTATWNTATWNTATWNAFTWD